MIRRNSGCVICLTALSLLTLAAFSTSAKAETLRALALISPLNEVPPITNLNASGGFELTIEITRAPNGNITSARISFLGIVQFPGAVTITGLRIYEGETTTNGAARFDAGISSGSPIVLAAGAGIIDRPATQADPVALARLLANPAGFYLNVHTSANPDGALRAQLSKLTETLANTVTMTTAQEVPAPTGQTGTAQATLTFNPTRDAQGQVNGGSVLFTLLYDFSSAVTFTGLHIHEGAAGVPGPVRINTGLSGANPIVSTSGKGVINLTAPVSTADEIGALSRLLANPTSFYVNLHTTVNPGGVIRAQLTLPLGSPAVITLANKYFLPTSANATTLSILPTDADLLSTVLINGQAVQALFDPNTGNINISVPAALLANPGTLMVQVRNSNGLLSKPLFIPVAAQAALNPQAVVTVEAAGFSRASVAPETIAAAFGTRLASQIVSNTPGQPLPTSLDGTTVYVNGTAAPLFFVSATQINYLLPEGTTNGLAGPATVLVVARDGTVSQGQVLVTNVAPGIFTRTADGLGAPAAVASTDGVTFPISLSNADGTPVAIDAGNIVAFFGTGLRFKSGAVTATAGGVTATPSFVGAQGLVGLDQINLTIPQALAGKGEMDLVFTLDGRRTNAVRIKVR